MFHRTLLYYYKASNMRKHTYINSGKPKNNTGNDETETHFYGPATTCEELAKLGYTLNGLYLVDCKDKSKRGIQIEVIECRFKQPFGSKEGVILYALMTFNFT